MNFHKNRHRRLLPFLLSLPMLLTGCAGETPKPPSDPVWQNQDDRLVVVVDAGHGYADPGAVSSYLGDTVEADLNLDMAQWLSKLLTEAGVTVVMTRDGTVPAAYEQDPAYVLDPYGRVDMANGVEGLDLFVSVHCDSFPQNEEVRGLRVHYDADNTAYTEAFAQAVADAADDRLAELGSPAAKCKKYTAMEGGIYVLRHIPVPSILIEAGFITSEEDASLLLTETYRKRVAASIAEGILRFTGWDSGQTDIKNPAEP